MLKVPYQKLRLKCKGSLNHKVDSDNSSESQLQLSKVDKRIVQGIPVFSIFALLGIMGYTFNPTGFDIITSNQAYAAENPFPSAALIIDDGVIKEEIYANTNELAYTSHKISVQANNIDSFALTLTGPTNITDGNTVITGAAGAIANSDTMINKWGYAWLSENDDPTTASYKSLSPTGTNDSGFIIDNNHNIDASKRLVLGAKFGSNATGGTYHASVNLSLAATPRTVLTYSVNVNCNGGSNCTPPLNITANTENYDYTISDDTPSRTGYHFLGYSSADTTYAERQYSPGNTITLTTDNHTQDLYAIWQQVIPWSSLSQMQQMTPEACLAAPNKTNKSLTDARGGGSYNVAKLDDGNCWMTQNLRLSNKNLTPSDSDVEDDFFLAQYASSGTPTTDVSLVYGNSASQTNGYLYNWFSATAGSSTKTSEAGDIAPSSICPKNWKLPTQDDYNQLFTAANITNSTSGSTTLRSSPYSFTYTGFAEWIYPTGTQTLGLYWTSTSKGGKSAEALYFESSMLGVGIGHNSQTFGMAVRCIAYSE